MPTTCKIHFNKHIVCTGQKIIITVRLKLTEEIKFRSIIIHLRGKTQVHFVEDDCKREGSYHAHDNVLDMKKCLEEGNGGEIQHKIAGTYDYCFQCILPHNLPSSYWDFFGNTEYTAEVTINIPRWPDKTLKKVVFVDKSIDLNDFPSLKNSVTFQKESTVELRRYSHSKCASMYSGGPFNILARTDYGGYVPGQFIKVEVQISNKDRLHAIESFHVRLVRKVIHFKSENSKHQKTTCRVLKEIGSTGCQIGQHKKFHVHLKVPCTKPTDTESKLIKIEYLITIVGHMGNYQNDLSYSIPITIGTVRIHDASASAVKNLPERKRSLPSAPPFPSNARFVLPSAPPDDDTVSIRTYASTPPPFPDDEFDLPTYDEAMLLNLDDEFDDNLENIQQSFAQLYKKP